MNPWQNLPFHMPLLLDEWVQQASWAMQLSWKNLNPFVVENPATYSVFENPFNLNPLNSVHHLNMHMNPHHLSSKY